MVDNPKKTPWRKPMLTVADYPQLRLLVWNRPDCQYLDEAEAFAIYEANWRFVDQGNLEVLERENIAFLTKTYGNGVMNV